MPSRYLLRIIGILFLVLPFLPISMLFGGFVESKDVMGPYQWLLLFSIFALCTFLLSLVLSRTGISYLSVLLNKCLDCRRFTFLVLSLTFLGLVLTLVATVVFQQRPAPVDSVIQLFQAKIFAEGALYATVPKYPEFFMTPFMLVDGDKWYGQYPPGHSILLALGVLVSAAWVVPVVLSLLSAVCLFYWLNEIYDSQIARLSVLTLVLCPFYIFMGASYMSHVSTFFFVVCTLWAYSQWESRSSSLCLALAGFVLGCAFVTRPLCAISVGLPLALFGLPKIVRERAIVAAIAAPLGFACSAWFYFYFNFKTTGDPLLAGYIKLWGDAHGLGFHESPWGEAFTPFRSLGSQLYSVVLLNEFFFESPLPALFPLSLYLLCSKRLSIWDKRLIVLFCFLPATYFFYWHRDSFLGPRYLYLGVAYLIPLLMRSLVWLFDWASDRQISLVPSQPKVALRTVLCSSLVVCLLYMLTLGIPLRVGIYANSLASMKKDIIAEAKAEGIDSGLIFIPVSWGTRILSKMLAYGLPAAFSEKLYRNSDHCLLHQSLESGIVQGLTPEELQRRLERLHNDSVEVVPLNKDRTLRLRPNAPLAASCAEEIRYDRDGAYGIFMPHLADNHPWFEGEYVIATDMRMKNNLRLAAEHPDLEPFLYREGEFHPLSQDR